LQECPRRWIDQRIVEACNLAGIASKGLLPVSGGVLDQSAWFVSVWQMLESEQNRIDQERAKRNV
jgi:hypothetical protein